MSPTVTDKAHRTQQFPNGKVSFPVSLRIERVNLLSKSSKFAFNEVDEAGANNLMHFCGDCMYRTANSVLLPVHQN